MRSIASFAALALWGCSSNSDAPSKSSLKPNPTSFSCPNAVSALLKKAINGEKMAPNDGKTLIPYFKSIGNDASDKEREACLSMMAQDKTAWQFVYGDAGPTKMADFKAMDATKQREEAATLISRIIGKSIVDEKPLQSGTCPQDIMDSFEQVIQGKQLIPAAVGAMKNFKKIASKEDIDACVTSIVNDPRAWEYIYGNDAPSKIAEFKGLNSNKQKKAAYALVNAGIVIAKDRKQITTL